MRTSEPSRDPERIRPAFVWALAVVAVPILALFGTGFVTDTDLDGSLRIPVGVGYVVGAWIAPIAGALGSIKRGAPPAKAVATAIAFGMMVLVADLQIMVAVGFGGAGLVGACLVTAGSICLHLVVMRSRPRIPARPDLG